MRKFQQVESLLSNTWITGVPGSKSWQNKEENNQWNNSRGFPRTENGASLSNFWGKTISNLEFYVQSDRNSNVRPY